VADLGRSAKEFTMYEHTIPAGRNRGGITLRYHKEFSFDVLNHVLHHMTRLAIANQGKPSRLITLQGETLADLLRFSKELADRELGPESVT
jgi:hypothetical protein